MNILKPKIFVWILLFIFTIPTFYSLVRPGFFPMQDDLQAFRIFEMDKCFQELQFPCRWVPDPGYQYGYPQFIYYPPGVYYLGEIIHLIGFQFIDSVKILFAVGFVFSAFAMFLFLRNFLGIWPGFVGTLLYTYIPYKAVEVYVRGAMSEFWALVFFPLLFWSSYMLIKKRGLNYFCFFAISVALLLTTHNLMSLIFFPVLGIWILSLIILEKKWKETIKIGLSGLFGLGLAAFFTLPVLFERQFAHTESLLGGYFDYRQHFVDVYQLFISNHWGFGSSYLGPGDDLSLTTGHVQWVLSLLAVILGIVNFRKNKELAILTFVLSMVELLVLFMMHQKSSFLWSPIPFLTYLQFPWRFNAVSIFLLSALSAISIYQISKLHFKKSNIASLVVGILSVVIAFVMYASFFQPLKWLNISDKDKFSGNLWEKQLTISIFDYLPIYAKLPPIEKAPKLPEVMSGDVDFISYVKKASSQKGEILVFEKSRLRLPLFHFPGMKVFIDGKEVKHIYNDCRRQEFCLGLITFDVSPGRHIIEARLTNTFIRSIGDYLTLTSLVFVVFLFYVYYSKKKIY